MVTALNGKLALKSALEHRPCLVLTDMLMPKMTGAEVCERLKAMPQTRETAVVIMSSLPQQAIGTCGADGYIAKPFSVGDIVKCVYGLLR